jgi:biopolymer transport protein ExbB/TolQ
MEILDKSILTLIWQSGVFAKFILLVLLSLSIIAWTITLFKTQEFGSLLRNFRKIFGRSSQNEGSADLRELFSRSRKTPISRIYQDGERALKTAVSLSRQAAGETGREPYRLSQVDSETDSLFAS